MRPEQTKTALEELYQTEFYSHMIVGRSHSFAFDGDLGFTSAEAELNGEPVELSVLQTFPEGDQFPDGRVVVRAINC